MVGFVHNHPDRPFVMGGMFHGQVGLGGGINNHMRSIQTKSGIKVLMNDDEKSVTILDPSGNTWFMDGEGSITVTAPKNFTVNAGENVSINAGMNITSVAGQNVATSAGMNISESATLNHSSIAGGMMMQNAALDYSLMAKNIMEVAKGERKSEATKIKEVANGIDKQSTNANVNIQGKGKVITNSGEKNINH